MTPVGHSLTGLAIGVLVVPSNYSTKAKSAALAAFVLLANAPDLPLPGWGHDRYVVSHSVFATAAGIVIAALLIRCWPRFAGRITPAMWLGGAAAWYSHLLLDAFYNHGKGIAVFWPLSQTRIALPIPWFATMQLKPLFGPHNLRVFVVEFAAYSAILLFALATRRLFSRSASPAA